MTSRRILSWNVNGIRAVEKKGFVKWLQKESPDMLCIQETKASPDQLSKTLLEPPGYQAFWSSAQKKGYSGVVTYSKEKPASTASGIGIPEFDGEGRIVVTEHPNFLLFNVYFPNGKQSQARLDYKMDFYRRFLAHIEKLRKQGKNIVVCGDYNTAHKEIDIAHPKENEDVSGFLPIERKWMDELVDTGYVDTFRHFHKEPNQYSWWDYMTKARERNIGWRIDYFFVSKEFMPHVKDAFILSKVEGSDHCPVGITVDA